MADQELVTIRGLVDSEFGTPLRKFVGTLDSYYPEERKFGDVVVLNFRDVEVLKSIEPYNFPIAQIAIKLSNKKNSAWGVFGESLAQFLSETEDIGDCVGKKIGLEMEEGHKYGADRATGQDMLGNPWKVYEVEGAVASSEVAESAADRALSLLIGKTRADFNKAAYADPLIRKDVALQKAITDKSFINAQLQLGTVVEDGEGVFHKPE